MKEITRDMVEDWHRNPVTQTVYEILKNSIEETKEQSRIAATIDETVINTARAEGYIEGIRLLFDIINELRDYEE